MRLSTVNQFIQRHPISAVLLCLIAWLYLFLPASAPLALDGLPLDHKTEFLFFIALSLTIIVVCVSLYLVRIGIVPPRQGEGRAATFRIYLEIAGILLLATLIVFKLFFPESRQVTACFEVPGVKDRRCAFLPEGYALHDPNRVSRFEEAITFGSPVRPWRLAFLNDARIFDVYNRPAGTPERRVEELRRARSYPFQASFRLGEGIVRLLQQEYGQNQKLSLVLKYAGAVDFSGAANDVAFPYSETEQRQAFDIPVSTIPKLVIKYRNFQCVQQTPNTSNCARFLELRSLPLEAAFLDVLVVRPTDGKEVSLGYAPLLAQGEHRRIIKLFEFFEALAGAIVIVVLLLWLYPYFSSVPQDATQFFREARQDLPAVFQLIVIGAVGAAAISAFYSHLFPAHVLANGVKLTTLLPWGAVYASLLWILFFSKGAKHLFKTATAILGPRAVIVALAPILIYIGLTLRLRVAPMNEATLLSPGDDPFIYASDAMGILEKGVPRTSGLAFTHFAIKPLFLHFKALYYAMFGGGEAYYSVLLTTAFLLVWSLILVFALLARLARVEFENDQTWQIRIAIAAACAISYISFSRIFLTYGAIFGGMAFSEGPAWLFGTASFALLLTLTASLRPLLSLWLIGVLFAGTLCFRTQYVMFLPALISVCAFLRPDLAWKRLLLNLCLPVVVLAAFFLLYYLFDPPTTAQSQRFFFVATPFTGALSWDLLLRQTKLLFPSYWECLSALTVLSLLIWSWISNGATKRLILLIAVYTVTVLLFDGIIAGHSGYHPRHIVMTFFLSACTSLALIENLLISKRTSMPATAAAQSLRG